MTSKGPAAARKATKARAPLPTIRYPPSPIPFSPLEPARRRMPYLFIRGL
jgi:hypothetical protein